MRAAVHQSADEVIVENLVRLTELDASAEVTILPPPIRGDDGSPGAGHRPHICR
jgi:kynurenine formamidase